VGKSGLGAFNRRKARPRHRRRAALVTLAPNNADIHCNFGSILERAGRLEQAEAEYQRAVEISPNLALAHRNLAALYDGREDIDRAIPQLTKSLELAPSDLEGWVNLSNLRRRAKDYHGAIADADRGASVAARFAQRSRQPRIGVSHARRLHQRLCRL